MVTLRAHGDGSIFADHRDGREPCLLGLHGWGRDRHDMGPMLEAVGHRSVAPDLPGFGASAAPGEAWGAARYAAVLADQLLGGADGVQDGPHSGPYVVVGHSFGGRVGVCLAADHPELVCGLVLMGVPLLRLGAARRPPLRYRLIRAAARARLLPSGRLEAARQRFGSDDYRAAAGVMRDVLVRVVNEDYRDELERVQCPVALVWGEQDQVVPPQVADRSVNHIRRLALSRCVEGAGHDVHIDAPEAVAEAVDAVVAESAGPSR